MGLLRITDAKPIGDHRLRLTLTDGSIIERDVSEFLVGPVFAEIRENPESFASARVENGTVVWPNGADLCPDVLIWNGPPPAAAERLKDPGSARPTE